MIAKAKAAPSQPAAGDELEFQEDSARNDLQTSIGRESSNYISEQLKAITERRAGRVNAASISQREVEDLHSERRDLLQKQYTDGLSSAETRRLALIRWSLDRIDDARSGEILDALESAIVRYEAAREEIRSLMTQISDLTPTKRRK